MKTKWNEDLSSQKIETFGFHFSVFGFEIFPIFEYLNLKEINSCSKYLLNPYYMFNLFLSTGLQTAISPRVVREVLFDKVRLEQ